VHQKLSHKCRSLAGASEQPSLPFDAPGAVGDGGRTSEPRCSPSFVRHSRARRYSVRVRSDGSVRVTIPRGGSKREAERFAASQHEWIERQRARVALEAAASPSAVPPELVRDLRTRAGRELPSRLLELAAEHGLTVGRVSVRNQQWRWGSCSPSGHICLNWRLVQMPDWVRDYVMIHELMHLKRMDHSPRFWKLVARACPGYQDARAWLRRNQTLLGPK
jgi:predicted metal-dependent hydrolase